MEQRTLFRLGNSKANEPGLQHATGVNARPDGKNRSLDKQPLEICMQANLNGLEREWRLLEEKSNISIYQRFDWVKSSIDTIDKNATSQPLIVTIRENGKLVMILPFLIKGTFIRRVIWVGGKHSNYNMAIVDPDFGKLATSETIKEIFRQISCMQPGIGYIKLCCQPLRWEDEINPLVALQHQHSTNTAFSMDLSGGFEHVLAYGNAKRKRKKFRYQRRELERYGKILLLKAETETQVQSILDEFYRQKAERFAKLGMHDVFADKGAKELIANLSAQSLTMDAPILNLFALEIDGKYRAIMAGGTHAGRFSACFSSFREDELSYTSPGEMLIYMLAEHLCDQGYQSFDLGAGDERYKRSWCSDRLDMFDVIMPLSIWSIPIVFTQQWFLWARRLIRENALVWAKFKKSRSNWKKVLGKISSKQ